MPVYIAKSGDLDRCYRCLTHSLTKDSATQLLRKYKSGALVTQYIGAFFRLCLVEGDRSQTDANPRFLGQPAQCLSN